MGQASNARMTTITRADGSPLRHRVPEDDFTDSTSLSINEQSLGNDDGAAAMALAPISSFSWGSALALSWA